MPTPLPVIPGTYYGSVIGAVGAEKVTNTLCFHLPGLSINDPADAANALTVATAVGTHWGTALSHVADDYFATEARFYPLGSATLPAYSSFFGSGGGASGPTTLLQACFVLSHSVVRRGRGSQGLTRLGPVKATQIISPGNNFAASEVAFVQSDYALFISDTLTALATAVPGPWEYVQLSKKGAGQIYPIVNTVCQPYVGSARERLSRV